MTLENSRPGVTNGLVLLPIVGAIIAALVAAVISITVGAEYESTVKLELHGVSTDRPAGADRALGFDPQRIVNNNREILETRAVLEPAASAMDISVEELEGRLSFESERDSDILTVKAAADDPALAQRTASAVADSFVALLRDDQLSELTTELDALTLRIEELRADSPTRADVIAELGTRVETIRTEILLADGGVRVIEPALAPQSRSRSFVLDSLFGAFLGLVIGVGVAVFVVWWPRSANDEEPTGYEDRVADDLSKPGFDG